MKSLALLVCMGVAVALGGCNEVDKAEASARGQLQSTCRYVYKTVEKIDLCNLIAQNHYDLEQKYFPGDPQKVADKVLADLFPSAIENERRQRDSYVQGASYKGPAPSELYEAIR